MDGSVDLRRLGVLRMIAHHGTVTAAAEALHLTPSAVSHQMRQLSRELQVDLLAPQGRGVVLTPAARRLLHHADVLHAGWERAKADLAAHVDGPTGVVRLTGFSTVVAGLFVPAAAALRASHPGLEVEIVEVEGSLDGFDRLLSATSDLALVVPIPGVPPLDDGRFTQRQLLTEPLDLLVPVDHPLAARAEVALTDAAEEPWVLSSPGPCDLRPMVLAACAAAGFSPPVAQYAKTNGALAAVVSAGFGVTLMPRLADLPQNHPVKRVPLVGDPPPSRRILAATRRGSENQPHVAAVWDALLRVADRAAAPVG